MSQHSKTRGSRILCLHAEILQCADHFQSLLTNLCYEGKPRLGYNIRQTKQILTFLKRNVVREFQFEETKLFPFFLRQMPILETLVHFLETDHGEFRNKVKVFEAKFKRFIKTKPLNSKVAEALQESGMYLVCLLRHHVQAKQQLYKVIAQNYKNEKKRS